MQDDTQKINMSKFARAPEIFDACENIGNKFGLHIDQVGELDLEIRLILLGRNKPDDFITHLVEKLEINKKSAEQIAVEVNEQVFKILRTKMQEQKPDQLKQSQPYSASAFQPIQQTPIPQPSTGTTINPTTAPYSPVTAPISHVDLEKAGNFTIEKEVIEHNEVPQSPAPAPTPKETPAPQKVPEIQTENQMVQENPTENQVAQPEPSSFNPRKFYNFDSSDNGQFVIETLETKQQVEPAKEKSDSNETELSTLDTDKDKVSSVSKNLGAEQIPEKPKFVSIFDQNKKPLETKKVEKKIIKPEIPNNLPTEKVLPKEVGGKTAEKNVPEGVGAESKNATVKPSEPTKLPDMVPTIPVVQTPEPAKPEQVVEPEITKPEPTTIPNVATPPTKVSESKQQASGMIAIGIPTENIPKTGPEITVFPTASSVPVTETVKSSPLPDMVPTIPVTQTPEPVPNIPQAQTETIQPSTQPAVPKPVAKPRSFDPYREPIQ